MWDYVVKETRQFNGDHKIMKERLEQLSLYVEYLENSRLHQVTYCVHKVPVTNYCGYKPGMCPGLE